MGNSTPTGLHVKLPLYVEPGAHFTVLCKEESVDVFTWDGRFLCRVEGCSAVTFVNRPNVFQRMFDALFDTHTQSWKVTDTVEQE